MNPPLDENALATMALDAALAIHRKLGPGLKENVYESILAAELEKKGLQVQRQVPIPVQWGDMKITQSFRADIIVENRLIIEVKALPFTQPAFARQVLTYLQFTGIKLGLLINFGRPLLKEGIKRIINGMIDTASPRHNVPGKDTAPPRHNATGQDTVPPRHNDTGEKDLNSTSP